MDLRDHVGAGHDQQLVAALELGAAEVVGSEAEQLQVGAHGAVEDDHALAQRLQVAAGRRVEPATEFKGRCHHQTGYRRPATPPGRRPTAPVASGLVTPRIYTKTGDDGTTGLLFGGRVRKDSWRMEVNGAVDEAQAAIGVARAETPVGSELDDRSDLARPAISTS